MDYVRERKISAAANEIAEGKSIFVTALVYGFETPAGFTCAFSEVIGCTPQVYYKHNLKLETKGGIAMDTAKLKVRLVCWMTSF